MLGFSQRYSRVSFSFLTHVVLALCLLSALLIHQVNAQEERSNNGSQAAMNENEVDAKEKATERQAAPKTTDKPSLVVKTPTQKLLTQNLPGTTKGARAGRWRAPLLKGGCAQAVSDYLKRIHEDRKSFTNAVSQARKELNAARLHKPQNVLSAEQRLNATKKALSAFDTETLQLFGESLPKTCISEVQDRMGTAGENANLNSIYNVTIFIYQTVVAHSQAFYLTIKGVWNYTIESYIPIVKDFQGFSDVYYKKAVKLYNEAHPKPGLFSKIAGKQKDVPTSEFIMKIMEGLAYACVPLMLVLFIALMIAFLFPVILFGVLMPDFIYHVWIRLFIFYYPYAMVFPADFIIELKGLYVLVLGKNWLECWMVLRKGIMGIVTDFHELFYNTVLMGQMVWLISFILMVLMWKWLCFFVIRKKRTKKNLVKVESTRRDENKSKPRGKSKKQ